MKEMGRLTLGLALIFILTACGPKVVTWQEEAKQADGSMLLLTRTIRMGGGSEIGQSAPVAAESIQFTHPKTGRIMTWNAPQNPYLLADPLLIQLDGNRIWVLTLPRSCGSWERYGRPNPSFILIRLEAGVMHTELVDKLPKNMRYMNLLFWPKDEYNLDKINNLKGAMKWNNVYDLNERRVVQGTDRELIDINYSYNMLKCGD